jgi:hypothetical protein
VKRTACGGGTACGEAIGEGKLACTWRERPVPLPNSGEVGVEPSWPIHAKLATFRVDSEGRARGKPPRAIEVLGEQVHAPAAIARQRAERDTQLAESPRDMLIRTGAVLTCLLTSCDSGVLSAAEPRSLLALALETAQNLTHLRYVSRFAGFAGKIVVAPRTTRTYRERPKYVRHRPDLHCGFARNEYRVYCLLLYAETVVHVRGQASVRCGMWSGAVNSI